MAEEVVSVALGTLRDLLLEEGRFLVRVGGEVKALEKQLKEINCLLRDADAKQHKSETVRNWITEIRDLAYRAEDVVAEYSVRMSSSSSSSSDGWGQRLVRRFSGVLRCCSLHQLGSEMLDIKLDLERITKLMEAYGIRNIITDSGDNQNPARKTFPSSEIGDCFLGKEEELKRIASLLADDKQHRVISVWGMGGIGKTTIAKKVYNQMKKEVRSSSFDSFAWVCISQQCQTRSVWEDVLKQLDPAERGESVSRLSDTGLIEKLCEVQRAKRCLIVVDDLWQTSHWDWLKPAFLVQNVESKILVTTRKRKVADIGFPIQLGLLSVDDAWELLKKKAFPHGHIPEFAFEEKLLLEKVGKEMVEKCGRLPLAISLLGGVLSKKKSMDEWESVKENLSTYLHSGDGIIEEENKMLAVLNLSYEDLPYYLKPCFLYLGVFKEDETICPVNLYKRWIAQGMISDEMIGGERKTLTHVAEFCLSELASRCMIQVEVDDALPSLKYTTCKLHDAMRELCLSMGKRKEFGVEVLEYRYGKFESSLHEASSSSNITIKARHLAIHFPGEFQLEGGGDLTITNCERLRSLELLNVDLIIFDKIQLPPKSVIDFEKFKMLRELLIKNFSFKGRKLPRGITKLVHLRYLGIQSYDLDELPSSISNLAYLDTLDLSGSLNLRVPNHAFKKMLRFKHLILSDCVHVGHHRSRLDEGLDELETLEGFDSSVHELKSTVRMTNLRRFVGDIHDNESLLAILNAITRNWNKLEFCLVSIKHGCELGLLSTSEEVLMKLKEAFTCPNLHGMGIYVWVGSIGKILDECILGSKLELLILQYCRIEDDPMGILGNLPCLTQLGFYEGSYVGEEMMCPASSFSCLKKLDFEDLPNLREWRVEQGSMPLLSRLKIGRCRSFEEWRVERGAMPLLSELKIFACPALKKVPDRVSKHVSS